MPEFKRYFTSGRMNKDFDERIVPQGEYRDALNIQVSTSEDSDIGAIENVLGNTKRINKSQDPVTGLYTEWALDSGGKNKLGMLNPVDVSVVKDVSNKKIYYITKSDDFDSIVEYDKSNDIVSPILVDYNNVLNLTTDYITGIDILDGYLYFTDNNSEPKVIDIEAFKTASASTGFSAHTQIYARDFIESDIAVIKDTPDEAPNLEFYNTKRLDQNGDPATVENTTLYNFMTVDGDGDPIGLTPGTEITLTWQNTDYPFFIIGDTLFLTADAAGDDDFDDYEVRVKVSSVPATNPQTQATVTVLNVIGAPSSIILWNVELEQDPPLFEFKFPRFSYRYVFNSNQVSAFAPFSEIAFLPDSFEYNSERGYNLGMSNQIRQLIISGYSTSVPADVKAIDIIYRDSSNQNAYVVDQIKKISGSFQSKYAIKSEIISRAIESNQILRPWDNVPRKAKAQAITGNRIVYSNYLQNFNIKKNNQDIIPNVSINIKPDSDLDPGDIREAGKSIKTLRTYQAGILYGDAYGRETPVFSSEQSSLNFPKEDADKFNRITTTIKSDPPDGLSYFKFFIKENSNEYYNLAMDRFYLEEDTNNVWLSFPSSERNKIDEETFLILKKQFDSDKFVKDEARYKVIAIENEAPDVLKEERISKGKLITDFETGGIPTDESITIFVDKTEWNNSQFGEARQNIVSLSNLSCKIVNDSSSTDRYFNIDKITLQNTAGYYEITLKNELIGADNIMTGVNPGIEIFQLEVNNKPEFEGRFFVKIYSDSVLKENVIDIGFGENFSIKHLRAFGNIIKSGDSSSTWQSSSSGWYIDNSNPGQRRSIASGGLSGTPAGETYEIGGYQGRGSQVGSRYIDFCYFRWGDKDRHAWNDGQKAWWNFETKWKKEEAAIVSFFQTPGSRFRFSQDPDQTVYTVKDFARVHIVTWDSSEASGKYASSRLIRWVLKLDKPLEYDPVTSESLTESVKSNIEFLTRTDTDSYTSKNPAIWETEPKEEIDLNIFYEASDKIPIAQHGSSVSESTHELDWFNCYSFGNGVESDRIRDDYNAPRIGKGFKVSATLDEPYEEERRSTGFIFSQIYNSTSGTNRLNQFIQALNITKDVNPEYGSVQFLHERDTNLVVFSENKILQILANKDALFNADGSVNVTSNENVLGQSVPYEGEFGISIHPQSFAFYGFRMYCVDQYRGTVLRVSRDGIFEISSQGMSDYLQDKLKTATIILGSYDENERCYNIHFADETISYNENVRGWSSRKSFIPNLGISLDNEYYTIKDGLIWSHDNTTRNTFYDGSSVASNITFIFNEEASLIKNYKTLNYEGTSGWTCPSMETDLQSGQVPSFKDKEGKFYEFIKGVVNTWDNDNQSGSLDTKEFSTQGIGTLDDIEDSLGQTEFTLTIKENAD
jgi:hypothetical protein